MGVKDLLMEELKRLNRRNDILEKKQEKNESFNLAIDEAIQKNALAMCEIVKAIN